MKMKKLLVAAACLPLALMAQEDRYAQITNPRLTSINKEQPRSTFTSYTNEADAVINDRKNGTFRISLNGKWKFNYVENFADRPTDFMAPHTDVSKWPDINVPGNWELQGFGTPIYVNQSYEFCSPGYAPYWDKPNPPYVPKEWNPTGTYRRTFTLPADWDNKEIFLSADGVRGAAFYYLNGKFAGMSKDSKTPARFNVTSLARRGENVIAIQVHRFSDGNYLECQDFWRISGIERDIYMYAQPQIHLTDFKADSPGRRLPQRNSEAESEVCQRNRQRDSVPRKLSFAGQQRQADCPILDPCKLRSDGSGVYPKDNQRTVAVDSRNA